MEVNMRFLNIFFSTLLFWNLGAFAQSSKYFDPETSLSCGIAACQVTTAYNVCQHAKCGTSSRREDCGQRWGGCGNIGGPPVANCPAGCYRGPRTGIAGCMRKTYTYIFGEKVDGPKLPGEKRKWQCFRSVSEHKICQVAECGVKERRQTGRVDAYNSCTHPSHSFRDTVWEADFQDANNKGDRNRANVLRIYRVMSDLYENGNKKRSGQNDIFSDVVDVTMYFLENSAAVFPDKFSKEIAGLLSAFESRKTSINQDDLNSVLGKDVVSTILTQLPSLKFACEPIGL